MVNGQRKISLGTLVVFALVAAFVLIVPSVTSGYSMMIVNLSLIYAIATYGLSVMLGMGGMLSFAAVSFMGGGAYWVANLCTGRLGVSMEPWLALLLAPVVFAVAGFIIGSILLKLNGTYFTFATIALVQVAWCLFQNYRPLFGGPDGISGIATLEMFGLKITSYTQWFYVLAAITLIVALLVERIRRTQLGRSLAAIRDNQTAAQILGVDVYHTKVIAFTIAAALGALSGALYCLQGRFVSSDMFTFERATQFIIMAMLGGVNDTFGIFLGSVLITVLPESLRVLQKYLKIVYGTAIILLMIFMPMGIMGAIKDGFKKMRRKKREALMNVAREVKP